MGYFGNNKYKFGLFAMNCAGGQTPSKAPERWRAQWKDIVTVAKLGDEVGVEFILPVSKWYGLGGESNFQKWSFETFSQSAALAALTERIGLFVTAHAFLLSPAFAAKAIATLDHISNGRGGLNIVCGWNPAEFATHGSTIDPGNRYERGREWHQIFMDLISGKPEFEWHTDFYDMTGLVTEPLPVQSPPPIMSAGQSSDGQAFAAEVADILFTTMRSLEQAQDTCQRVEKLAGQHGRSPDVFVQTQMICRPTRKEALEYAEYYAVEMADTEVVESFAKVKGSTLSKNAKKGESMADKGVLSTINAPTALRYPGIWPGIYPVIGSPDDIVDELVKISATGVAGSALIFLNYLDEFPYFAQEVLPRMERAGLRTSQ